MSYRQLLNDYVAEFQIPPAQLYMLVSKGGFQISYTQLTSLLVNHNDRRAKNNEKFAKRILTAFLLGLATQLGLPIKPVNGFQSEEQLLTQTVKTIRKHQAANLTRS